MRRIVVFAAGVFTLAMLSAMVLAGQNSDAPAVQQQEKQPESLVDKAGTSSQPDPGKAGLSKRNRMKIEESEQRKLRQLEINKEQVADPQSK